MKGVLGASFVVAVGICIGVGCAESSKEEPVFGIGEAKPEPDAGETNKSKKIEADDDDDDSTVVTDDDDSADDDDDATSSSSSGGTSSSSSSGGSSSSSSSSSGGSSSSSGGTSGALDPCKVLTCNSSRAQGTISGDKAGSKTITGAASQWFTIDVTENDTGLFAQGRKLRLTGTLTSPPGKNFDLFLYVPDGGSQKTCTAGEESSEEPAGTPDKASLEWGEEDGSGGNGSKDDRTVTIEVREIIDASVTPPATCDPTAKWSLKLEGNK